MPLRLSLVSGSSSVSTKRRQCENGQAATDVVEAAFLLLVFVDGQKVSPAWYFRDLLDCTFIAQTLTKQGPNKITSYCLPVDVAEGTRIYD